VAPDNITTIRLDLGGGDAYRKFYLKDTFFSDLLSPLYLYLPPPNCIIVMVECVEVRPLKRPHTGALQRDKHQVAAKIKGIDRWPTSA
jgi:hypothetical protein